MQKFKPQFRRLLFIDRKIRDAQYPNASDLAREWECSTKTIHRDLDYLRDELDAPLEFSHQQNGYFYSQTTWFIPSMLTNDRDYLAMLVGVKALSMYPGAPLGNQLQSLCKRWGELLADGKGAEEDLFSRFTFTTLPSRPVNPDTWESVARGLISRNVLRVQYQSPRRKDEGPKQICPYHIANLQGEWYLFAKDCDSGETRRFVIARIKTIDVLDARFDLPPDFDPESLLGQTFGRYTHGRAGRQQEVVLRFSPELHTYISEKIWHSRQRIKRTEDGRTELRFPVADIYDAVSLILSFGNSVEVIKPKKLREHVVSEIRSALALYRRS